jgi:hypothetical protein
MEQHPKARAWHKNAWPQRVVYRRTRSSYNHGHCVSIEGFIAGDRVLGARTVRLSTSPFPSTHFLSILPCRPSFVFRVLHSSPPFLSVTYLCCPTQVPPHNRIPNANTDDNGVPPLQTPKIVDGNGVTGREDSHRKIATVYITPASGIGPKVDATMDN